MNKDMFELIKHKGKEYVSARQLHTDLGIKKWFKQWFEQNSKKAMLFENEDFQTLKLESTGGRPSIEYLLTEQTAIGLIMMSGGKNAKAVRLEVINAFQQRKKGVTLDVDQISALTDIVKAMTLVSKQKEAERKHYNYLNRPNNWYQYRADLLGYSKQSLTDAMILVNKKYKSQKQALINLDPAEIIRTGVIDLLIALGKDKTYALNVAEFAKVIAEKNGYHLQIWNDLKANPLGLNSEKVLLLKKINESNGII